MADVKFHDFTIQVKAAIDDRINAVLEECAGELESQAKRNTRVAAINGSKTKNNWRHFVDKDKHEAVIGNPLQNAIWEEFGTGEHALKGNGRKDGWAYKSDKDGEWYFTHGKTPSRAFWNAYVSLKSKIINRIQNTLKGL